MRRTAIIGAVVVACLSVLSVARTPPMAFAHYNINYHTWGNCADRNIVDPINIVFAGGSATFQTSSNIVRNEVGWEDQNTSSPQSIFDHSQCEAFDDARKLGTRRGHHTRLWQMNDRDRRGRLITVGDAHQERVVASCPGDAVYENINGRSGFDDGAREVFDALRGRYGDYLKRPNRMRFNQCNGDEPGWNGRQLFFRVP